MVCRTTDLFDTVVFRIQLQQYFCYLRHHQSYITPYSVYKSTKVVDRFQKINYIENTTTKGNAKHIYLYVRDLTI